VSNARDRNHLNLHLGVFSLLMVVDHAIGDVFIVTIQDKTCHGHQLQLLPFPPLGFIETCISFCDSAEFCEVVVVGLDGNTWLMIPAVKARWCSFCFTGYRIW